MVIDSDDYAASGIEAMFFPGGEPHAKLPLFPSPVVFVLKARTWNDVGIGACVWDALRRQQDLRASLFMPYSPGARQDRSDGTAPLTKALIASMFAVNAGLHVFDLHSELHSYNWRPRNWMPSDLGLPQRKDVDFVIAPDKGAVSRAESFRATYCPNAQLITATKERDPQTGKLSNYRLDGLTRQGVYLIVDDICDGGGTFNLLAEALSRYRDGSKLELFVSHGIFSKGLAQLLSAYDRIYTTDSFCRIADPNLTIHSLQPILERIANGN